jgi:sugar lactone lactonase YvrE
VGDTRTAALYRLDRNLTVTRVLPGLSISNGLGWSPDDHLMYHVDTPRRRIDVYEFDAVSGRLGGRRAAIPVPAEHGRPDGLAVDADGGIWVALWGGGAVQRYTPEGREDTRIELPVSQVTSCCFGDADLGTLYVTSATRGAEHESLAGSLFVCRPGVRGLPATPFAG